MRPTDPVEQLERFLGEVERVPAVEKDVVGERAEECVRQLAWRRALPDHRQQAALRRLPVPLLHELPEPPG